MKNHYNFYIESLGCIGNQADSNRVRKFLIANKHIQVNNPNIADIIIVMSCGVTQVAEDYNIDRISKLISQKKENSKIYIGGCLPAINRKAVDYQLITDVFSPRNLHKLDRIIGGDIKISTISPTIIEDDNTHLKSIRISTGCMSKCAYCAIPFANGKTVSRSIEDIFFDITEAINNGIKQIKLVSEDVGAYGLDINVSIIDLLTKIIKDPRTFTVYLDTINPIWFLKYSNDLLGLLENKKISKSICIPIQSGSSRILKLMNRGYSANDIEVTLDKIFKQIPTIKLSTDFIVGFPTERETDFDESLKIIEKYDFNHVQIFSYEDRPKIRATNFNPKISDDNKECRRQKLIKAHLKKILKNANVNDKKDLDSFLDRNGNIPLNLNIVLE